MAERRSPKPMVEGSSPSRRAIRIYIVKAARIVNSLLEDDPKDEIMGLPSSIVYGDDCINCDKTPLEEIKFNLSKSLDREVEINRMFDNAYASNASVSVRNGELGIIVYSRISCPDDFVIHRGVKMLRMLPMLEKEQALKRATAIYVCRPNDHTLEFRAFVHRSDVGHPDADLEWMETTLHRHIQQVYPP